MCKFSFIIPCVTNKEYNIETDKNKLRCEMDIVLHQYLQATRYGLSYNIYYCYGVNVYHHKLDGTLISYHREWKYIDNWLYWTWCSDQDCTGKLMSISSGEISQWIKYFNEERSYVKMIAYSLYTTYVIYILVVIEG